MNELHRAAIVGDLDGVQKALASGVAIDSIEEQHGNTALMLAAYNNRSIVVDWLLASGATVDTRCREHNTALMVAAFHGHLDVVKVLVGAGADVGCVDGDGYTAVRNAEDRGHTEIVTFLRNLPGG